MPIMLVALVAAGGALLIVHPEVLLLTFAGVLAAIFLDALSRPLLTIGVPRGFAIAAVVLLLVAISVGGALLAGPGLASQTSQLVERFPEMIATAENALSDTALGRRAIDAAERVSESGDDPRWQQLAPYVFGSFAGVFTTSLGVVAAALTVATLAVFIALQPEVYVSGALHLVSRARRERLRAVLTACAQALRWWILGRSIAMAIVAVITAVGLALLGVDLALVLGLLAGILTFVPYVGPILAALPAVLVALATGTSTALWVAAFYTVVQLVENNLITPIVQGRAISLPPALLIVTQLIMGVLLGVLGLVLATPLLVVVVVTIQALYVNDVLGERVALLGESNGETRRSRLPRVAGRAR